MYETVHVIHIRKIKLAVRIIALTLFDNIIYVKVLLFHLFSCLEKKDISLDTSIRGWFVNVFFS